MTTSVDVARVADRGFADRECRQTLSIDARLTIRRGDALVERVAATVRVAIAGRSLDLGGLSARAARARSLFDAAGLRSRPPALELDGRGAVIRIPVEWDLHDRPEVRNREDGS